jgi:uncharacterized membrane protein YcaP (DUF421 family)
MKPEDIKFGDWHRIIFGDVPGSYFIEIIIRTFVVYLVLMISLRLMGKRMAASLGRIEMISMISMAAAIGIPLQSPDRGLLPALIIAVIVVCTQKFVATKASRDQNFEKITQGNVGVLLEDGKLNLGVMKTTRISKERVFVQLRNKEICHLGEVKRLYIEANGKFTVVVNNNPGAGLSILPVWDDEFKNRVCKNSSELACSQCGNIKSQEKNECNRCGFNDWVEAVESK